MDSVGWRQQMLLLWTMGLAIMLSWHVTRCESQETGFCDQLVRPQGYSCEEHKVYTEDGYGILLHKIGTIPPSPQTSGKSASQEDGVSTLNLHETASSPVPNVNPSTAPSVAPPGQYPAELSESPQSDASAVDSFLEALKKPYQLATDYPRPYIGFLGDDSRHAHENIPVSLPFSTSDPASDSNEGPFEGRAADASPPLVSDPNLSYPATPLPSPSPSKDLPQLPPRPLQPFTSLASPPKSPHPFASPSSDQPWSSTSNGLPGSTVAPPEVAAPNPSPNTNSMNDPNTHNFPDNGRSVLLLHPELLNGDSWFKNADMFGHNNTTILPFALADAGLDVWIGHQRATYWSHDHLNLDSASNEYWNWSWDEHARFDVPAMLGYIRDTAQSRVHLVGVSESARIATAVATQVGLAMLMKSLILIGPNIYRGDEGSSMLQSWARLLVLTMNEPDFNVNRGQFNFTREFSVSNVSLGGPASIISGPDCCVNSRITLFDNGWDGITSYKNVEHIQQAFFGNDFRHYDYGNASRNMAAYGQEVPPVYPPEDISAHLPVLVIYGGQDQFSPPEAVEELFQKMQKKPLKLYLPSYAHFDLFFSSSRYQDVYAPIRSFLQDVFAEKRAKPTKAVAGQAAPPAAV